MWQNFDEVCSELLVVYGPLAELTKFPTHQRTHHVFPPGERMKVAHMASFSGGASTSKLLAVRQGAVAAAVDS